ncbi:MAG: hypothetical protein QOG49_1792, partial [Frankiaceae bacterium]|nr:hypothetical protein [Frankiaceae bacterium]
MNRGPTVGVLSPLVGGFYFGGVLSGINAAARARDGTVLAVQTFDAGVEHTDYHRPPRFTERIGWAHFDGVIVVVNAVDPDDLAMLVDSGKPIVMVSNDLDMGCSTVAPDNAGGISAAVDHLVAHGHSRIGFVGCLSRTDLRERYEAYLDAMKKHGLSTARSLHHEVDDSDEQGGRQAGRALLAAGIPSTALIAATDRNALGLMQCLSDAGLTLPRDQAIIGFDDTEAAEHAVPRLTSIRQDFREVGRTAADVLLDELQGVARSPSARRVPTTLVQRESCGCGRADAPLGAVTRITTRKNAQAQLRQALDLAVRRGAARSSSEPVALGQAVDLIVAELSAAVDDGPRVPGPDLNLAMRDLLRISPSVDVV